MGMEMIILKQSVVFFKWNNSKPSLPWYILSQYITMPLFWHTTNCFENNISWDTTAVCNCAQDKQGLRGKGFFQRLKV